MKLTDNIGVILLAAGSSSRLGQPKQLVNFEGKPLLQRIIDEVNKLDFELKLVVSGANQEIIFSTISLNGFQRMENSNWKAGMGSSIHIGVKKALEANPKLDHLLFLLSDQPLVNHELIKNLITTQLSSGKSITACQYGENFGVPAVFSRIHFNSLISLNGDQGAKKIMNQATKDITLIDFPEGTIDVDTPADLERLKALKPEKK